MQLDVVFSVAVGVDKEFDVLLFEEWVIAFLVFAVDVIVIEIVGDVEVCFVPGDLGLCAKARFAVVVGAEATCRWDMFPGMVIELSINFDGRIDAVGDVQWCFETCAADCGFCEEHSIATVIGDGVGNDHALVAFPKSRVKVGLFSWKVLGHHKAICALEDLVLSPTLCVVQTTDGMVIQVFDDPCTS